MLARYYRRKVAEGKAKKVVLVAIARKLLKVIYALLTSGKNYEMAQHEVDSGAKVCEG
jgi:hypothetical protein